MFDTGIVGTQRHIASLHLFFYLHSPSLMISAEQTWNPIIQQVHSCSRPPGDQHYYCLYVCSRWCLSDSLKYLASIFSPLTRQQQHIVSLLRRWWAQSHLSASHHPSLKSLVCLNRPPTAHICLYFHGKNFFWDQRCTQIINDHNLLQDLLHYLIEPERLHCFTRESVFWCWTVKV